MHSLIGQCDSVQFIGLFHHALFHWPVGQCSVYWFIWFICLCIPSLDSGVVSGLLVFIGLSVYFSMVYIGLDG